MRTNPKPGSGGSLDELMGMMDDAGIKIEEVQDHAARREELHSEIAVIDAGLKGVTAKRKELEQLEDHLKARRQAAMAELERLTPSRKPKFRRNPRPKHVEPEPPAQPSGSVRQLTSGQTTARARRIGGRGMKA